jgi:hypothetical protein
MLVEVFKTDVQEEVVANKITSILLDYFPDSRINFDLKDCDNILRLEGKNFLPEKVISIVKENGFNCMNLD